ncbi:deoxyribonuclease IV [Selenomonas ruminantium]|uniref:Probable endonuclease 4 n=1 Tax=Selenomonas ruminantium TaxID=971 RepID=A0A1H3VV90_SELRU|nr:deoxyribonuclease IV [Selenomonas ruminantium]SDZ78686.1 Endonuclease IV [Selenomonas ruminantium]
MLHIGCHLSSAKGYLAMGKEAALMQADTFAFFTRNPRGGKAKDIDPQDVQAFLNFASEHHFTKLVAHAPYTMNLCAAKENIRAFAHEILTDDLQRMEAVPGNYYNLHPGSHVGQGSEAGIAMIAAELNAVMFPKQTTTVLLETMAGKGTEVGRSFAELKSIIDRIELQDKIGICLDTCHIWDGGYDIVNNLNGVLEEFDRIIGLNRLKAIHLNDSLNPCGSHKDRHAKIGEGCIGLDALVRVINHPQLQKLPFILETPNDHDGYAREIALLRSHFHKK